MKLSICVSCFKKILSEKKVFGHIKTLEDKFWAEVKKGVDAGELELSKDPITNRVKISLKDSFINSIEKDAKS